MDVLLSTKLFPPPAPARIVRRPRLLARLDGPAPLALLSAPPGFGKTTLVSEWRESRGDGLKLAWLSLDPDDNEPRRFIAYLIAAVQTVKPEVGAAGKLMLESTPPTPLKTVLSSWLNDLARLGESIVLVVDDYHSIQAEPVHELMVHILEHRPPSLRLIITSRRDPPFALARWRARGELLELRASDLRFTAEEAGALLNQSMNLGVASADVHLLESRTEGWIAGLQMAALALRGQPDLHDVIAHFSGGDRFVGDYLAEEVFNRQPRSVQEFLLETSVLDRFCASLCEAVTGDRSSQARLDELDRANVFLVPLDHEGQWFRYHHLFSGFLRTRAARQMRADSTELHRLACVWLEANGLIAEAIKHALAAEDHAAAIRLVEQNAPGMISRGQVATFLHWIDLLPPQAAEAHARLALSKGMAEFVVGNERQAGEALALVEGSLDRLPGPEAQAVRDEEQAVRLAIAIERGDRSIEPERIQYLLARVSRENSFLRAFLAYGLGDLHRAAGRSDAAIAALAEARAIAEAGGSDLAGLAACCEMADLLFEQAKLREAEALDLRTIDAMAARLGPEAWLPALGGAYVGLGKVCLERNDLARARQYLEKGIRLAQEPGGLGAERRGYMALAFVAQAEGDAQQARRHVRSSEDLARQSPRGEAISETNAERARLWLLQGNPAAARRWARQAADRSDLAESEKIVLTRVWLAEGDAQSLDRAGRQLDRLRPVLEAGKRNRRLIEILALESLVDYAGGRSEAALSRLEQCLALAEPEGFVRTFLNEGQPMLELLGRASRAGIEPEYVKDLMDAFMQGKPAQPLVEPLSRRELDVLALLAQGASNREIAEKLVIAEGTVKRHALSIYQKLGVNSRASAIARARELNLLR